ncbi:hypothetical protein NIIDMKKI_60310 [Mycobacterium kansasii]|uniref:Uncharacterized protein n=1 Tax=Mycobacterium kansasii TaxID=1768 RepID=A0A7G1IM15_MYCKA|nr:hypothetical protein NIIDMKKI_60310 [Mycobacterium kansasii]
MFTGFAGELEVLLGDFPGRFDGLGAAAGEEHPVQVPGRVAGEPLGKLDRRLGGISPQREVRQGARLARGGLGEFATAVTDLHHEQPGQRVEVAFAAVVVDGDAVAAGDDRRCDSRAVAGEM